MSFLTCPVFFITWFIPSFLVLFILSTSLACVLVRIEVRLLMEWELVRVIHLVLIVIRLLVLRDLSVVNLCIIPAKIIIMWIIHYLLLWVLIINRCCSLLVKVIGNMVVLAFLEHNCIIWLTFWQLIKELVVALSVKSAL